MSDSLRRESASALSNQTTALENSNPRLQELRQQRREHKDWCKARHPRKIHRVYEVEEHMGSEFMEELSRLHQEHLNILRHNFFTM